eukprot:TRINITY_DN440_c0_g1_i5.p1 TRINITY_DN440_c0_g1~~TRINITY_DN440_c0_g1_i5.p1  ORF type:complete len:448 (+),score=77.41 TRINITY_DN440_c0_g1_i5:67-1410(+)
MGSCTSCTNTAKDTNTLHIISVVFNPSGYNSRVKLYNEYRDRLERVPGVRLYTIECLFDRQEPSVANRARDIVVRAPHKLWLKENLINIAVKRLPSDWKYMAWVDGDIEFHGTDWVRKTISALDTHPVVQMWKTAHFLGPDNRPLETSTSFGYYAQNQVDIDITKFHKEYPHPGFAWAMTRSAFERMGGLPEFCVVGSGDNHFAYALIGRVMDSIPPQSLKYVSDDYQKHLLQFQSHIRQSIYGVYDQPSFGSPKVGPGYVDIAISHHWHGDWKDRNYVSRWECLEAYPNTASSTLFRPSYDLGHTDEGVLYLKSTCFLNPIKKYFDSRKEDGMVVNTDHKNKHAPAKALPPAGARRTTNNYGGHQHRRTTNTGYGGQQNRRTTNTHHYEDDHDYYTTDYCTDYGNTNHCYDYGNNHCPTTDYGCHGGGGGGGYGGDVFSASNHAYC